MVFLHRVSNNSALLLTVTLSLLFYMFTRISGTVCVMTVLLLSLRPIVACIKKKRKQQETNNNGGSELFITSNGSKRNSQALVSNNSVDEEYFSDKLRLQSFRGNSGNSIISVESLNEPLLTGPAGEEDNLV